MVSGRAAALAYLFTLLAAASAGAADEDRGVILYERFLGSSSRLGNIFRLDSTLGYSFNEHFTIDGGLPVFFVRPSETVTALSGTPRTNGVGNAYLELRFAAANPLVNYSFTLAGTAPTGDKSRGLSTGRATVDWTNHFDRSFSGLTPFGNIGFANTVSDTPLFVRPYTTLGFVTHFDGGATYRVARFLEVGGSAYAIEPAGQQTVVSQLLAAPASNPTQASRNSRRGNHRGVFETTPVAVGSADLVRDNGFSAWAGIHPSRVLVLQAAYTHSVHYALDTVSFGIGFNLGSIVKSMWSY